MGKQIYKSETINHVTGEVTSTTKVKSFKGDEPSFIKLYLDDISYLYELPKAASELMMELLNYVTYGTQEIVLNKVIKDRISTKTGLAIQTINNRLVELVKKGVLSRNEDERGIFTLNPYLFGKGEWKDIKELREQNLHLKITYDAATGKRIIVGGLDEKEDE